MSEKQSSCKKYNQVIHVINLLCDLVFHNDFNQEKLEWLEDVQQVD